MSTQFQKKTTVEMVLFFFFFTAVTCFKISMKLNHFGFYLPDFKIKGIKPLKTKVPYSLNQRYLKLSARPSHLAGLKQ